MIILDGKATADEIKIEIAAKVDEIILKGGKRPHLAAILVGDDGASQTYVGHKEKACAQVGFTSTIL
ncbi:MAG TPA: tetrahydrofolate dehydrogenase/cyclohydrolase catalytic domain-containing protein, partial [Bacteroidales bacterium]|nr:tetrahydrofolate dehydrogenase/cyclohydrolase catalytic domain-containing protein [Bacteroidales bacterium]